MIDLCPPFKILDLPLYCDADSSLQLIVNYWIVLFIQRQLPTRSVNIIIIICSLLNTEFLDMAKY